RNLRIENNGLGLFSLHPLRLMGMFSSTPRNRKRRSFRKKSNDWIHDPAESPAPCRAKCPSSPKDQMHQLHAKIGAIESFLHQHHEAQRRSMTMRRDNILPPPDRSAHRQARKKMNLAAKRKYHAERNRSSFRFFLLFCTACALVWWIVFSGL
ncbi:MAG: hypothetical protein AAGC68_12960, partial [Verrucomicrobiota bacterium]